MTKTGETVIVCDLLDKRTRFEAVIGNVEGSHLELLCLQDLCARAAISMECEIGYAVGYVLAVANESDGLVGYRIKIQEIVIQREERIHMSWRPRRS